MSSEKDNNSSKKDLPKDSQPSTENRPSSSSEIKKEANEVTKEANEIKQEASEIKPESEKDETASPASTKETTTSQASSAKEPPLTKPGASRAEPAKKSSGGIFRFLFILLLLIVIGAGGYGGYWLYQHRSFFEQDYTALEQNLTALEQNYNTDLEQQRELIAGIQRGLEREREARIGLSSQYDNQLAEIKNGLVSQQNRLAELGGTSRRDWLLAEAEFLMRLANERLIIERDPANALALLQSADRILLDLDDPGLLTVRKMVARDITALQMVRRVDTQGIYLQLAAITEQVTQLPVSALQKSAAQQQAHQSATDNDLVWYQKLWQNFKSAVTNLRGLVRIQQNNQPVKALLAPEQEGVIRATLLLVLEQAQVAILRGDAEVYRISLDKAGQLLKDYFLMTDATAGLTGQLEQLRQQSLVEVYPDISGSLRSIKDYIDQYHSRYPVIQEPQQ